MTQSELPVHRRHVWQRAIVLAVFCVLLALAASSEGLHHALVDVLAASEQMIIAHPLAGATLFIVIAAVSAMFAFVSVAAIVPVAVFTWGVTFSIVLVWIGWIVGGLCAYGISRWLGRPAVAWLTSNQEALQRLERRISRDTPFGLVLLFQLALPSEIPGYVLGLVRYPLLRYLVALGIAELPYAVASVVLGQSFVAGHSAVVLVVGFGLACFGVGMFYLLRKRLKHAH